MNEKGINMFGTVTTLKIQTRSASQAGKTMYTTLMSFLLQSSQGFPIQFNDHYRAIAASLNFWLPQPFLVRFFCTST